MIAVLELVAGTFIVLVALTDAFETIVVPRTVSRRFRATNQFFNLNRWMYEKIGALKPGATRQRLLVAFAPSVVFGLIFFWGVLIVIGFSLMGLGLRTTFRSGGDNDFGSRLYLSATTFLTFGFGDIVPATIAGRWLAVAEAATGFLFLALVIGYVPVFYSAFSSREQAILLLDSKAGSDPTASEILRRHAEAGCLDELVLLFKDWEGVAAQLLENFLSYPFLAFYRSQHDDQSWLNSLTAVADACAICMCLLPDEEPSAAKLRFQSKATFVMARHLLVDFAYVLKSKPVADDERLNLVKFEAIVQTLSLVGLKLHSEAAALELFRETVRLYQPFALGLSQSLRMDLPEWIPSHHLPDNWQTSAWDGSHF